MVKLSENAQKIIETLSSCANIGQNAQKHYFKLQTKTKEICMQEDYPKFLNFFKALGNPDRLLILFLLQEQDRCVCELEAALEKSQPSISRHLRLLEEAKLIHGWKQGKFTHYSLIKPTFKDFLSLWSQWHYKAANWWEDLQF
jgi:ArsR family transcriptional regulator